MSLRRLQIFCLLTLALVSTIALAITVEQLPNNLKPFNATQLFFESRFENDLSVVFLGIRSLVLGVMNFSSVGLVINFFFSSDID
jgi:hypothetical protein